MLSSIYPAFIFIHFWGVTEGRDLLWQLLLYPIWSQRCCTNWANARSRCCDKLIDLLLSSTSLVLSVYVPPLAHFNFLQKYPHVKAVKACSWTVDSSSEFCFPKLSHYCKIVMACTVFTIHIDQTVRPIARLCVLLRVPILATFLML